MDASGDTTGPSPTGRSATITARAATSILGPASPESSRRLQKNANRNVLQQVNSEVGVTSLAIDGIDVARMGIVYLGIRVSTYTTAESMDISSGFYLSLFKLDLSGFPSDTIWADTT
jgi:hypothetical protein